MFDHCPYLKKNNNNKSQFTVQTDNHQKLPHSLGQFRAMDQKCMIIWSVGGNGGT